MLKSSESTVELLDVMLLCFNPVAILITGSTEDLCQFFYIEDVEYFAVGKVNGRRAKGIS